MSIFRRHDQGDVERTITAPYPDTGAQGGLSEQPANQIPAFAPPGVVPPPAAPIYSMRPSESAPQADGYAESSMAESFRRARDGQWEQEIAVEAVMANGPRARMTTSAVRGVGRRRASRAAPSTPQPPHRHAFDPLAATQAGLLNLAWRWQRAGAPIRAIHAYMELIARYPHAPAAGAAVADLVELSEKLAAEGHFHIAFGIYEELEELLA